MFLNVCSMNVIQAHYIQHAVIIMWSTSVTGFHKSSPMASWDSKVSSEYYRT